jgi:hypothetical protein
VLVGHLIDDNTRIPILLHSRKLPMASASVTNCEPALPPQLYPDGNCVVKTESFTYTGMIKGGKRHGKGVCHYHQSSSKEQNPGLEYTWSKGDKYDGEWKEDMRHGECKYTFFTAEIIDGHWIEGKCTSFEAKQNEIIELARSDAQAALKIFGVPPSAPAVFSSASAFPAASSGIASVGSPAAFASAPSSAGNPFAPSFGSNPFSTLVTTSPQPSISLSAPLGPATAATVDAAGSNSTVLVTDCAKHNASSEQVAFSLHSGEMLVQAVPTALRVAFEDILTSRVMSICVSGASGPDASAINGIYTYVAGFAEEALAMKSAEGESSIVLGGKTTAKSQQHGHKKTSSSHQTPSDPQQKSKKLSFLPLMKTTGDVVMEFRESARRLVVCRTSSAGAGEVLLFCPVPIVLPIYNSVPLILAACAGEPWFLGSTDEPQPNVSVALPSSCTNSIFCVSRSFFGGLPIYTSSDSQRFIRFNCEGRVWEMRCSQSQRVLAVSAANSVGFPAPLCWLELNSQAECDPIIRVEDGDDSSSSSHSCILVSGADVVDANGVYFTSKLPEATFLSAHMLGGLCSIENLEIEGGEREWILQHSHLGRLYSFKGTPSPFDTPTSAQGSWIPIQHSTAPRPVSIPLAVQESPVTFERIQNLSSMPDSHCRVGNRRVATFPISNVLTSTWTAASDWKFFCGIPLIMSVAHIPNTALADAALYEGNYELVDVLGSTLMPESHLSAAGSVSIYFRHVICRNILHIQLSSALLLCSACIYLEDDSNVSITSSNFSSSCLSSAFVLSPEHANSCKFSSNESAVSFSLILREFERSSRPTSVLNVQAIYKSLSLPKYRHVVNPHFVPTLTDSSHVSCIRELLTDDNADARQFWDKKLISLCGSSSYADTMFISNLLEFSKYLTSDKSLHPTTASIRHSNAFQAFVKLRMLAPMLPSISSYINLCLQYFEDFQQGRAVSFDIFLVRQEFKSKVTQSISQEIVTFVESLCSKADFQCFLITYVAEHYVSSHNRCHQMVLSAATSTISAIFNIKSNLADCLKLRALILGRHSDFGNFHPSHAKRLSQLIVSTEPTLREILRTFLLLIVATSSKESLQSATLSFLQVEMFQQFILFDDSINKLLKVCPSSILLFKEEVSKSKALLDLNFSEIVSAVSTIESNLVESYGRIHCGFQLPPGWTTVKSKNHERTYFLNTLSNVLMLQLPRPFLNDLKTNMHSIAAFLSIALFENSDSKCCLTETSETVAKFFSGSSSNTTFASSLSDAFSRLQAFHFLHHLPDSPSHPLRHEMQLSLFDPENADNTSAHSHNIKFGFSSVDRRRLCSKCLAYCSSIHYQVRQQQRLHASAAPVAEEDLQFMDEVFDLAQVKTTDSLRKPPQNGHGVFVFCNNDRYSGEFKAGKMEGKGTVLFSDGAIYRGQFEDGYLHGHGVLLHCDGTKYEGSFTKGKRNGKGTTIVGITGNIHVGDWKDDKKHGDGQYESRCDHRSNTCVIFAGEKYKGSYTDDWRNGVGTTTYFNGDLLTCKWESGDSIEHDDFQRRILAKSGEFFCISCVLNHAPSSYSFGDIGPTIAAVFVHERPLFQHCIRYALQRDSCVAVFSDVLGSPGFLSTLGSGCGLLFITLIHVGRRLL